MIELKEGRYMDQFSTTYPMDLDGADVIYSKPISKRGEFEVQFRISKHYTAEMKGSFLHPWDTWSLVIYEMDGEYEEARYSLNVKKMKWIRHMPEKR